MRRFAGKNRRLAVDKIEIPGLRALDAVGIEVCNGMQLMEHARAIKGHRRDQRNALLTGNMRNCGRAKCASFCDQA